MDELNVAEAMTEIVDQLDKMHREAVETGKRGIANGQPNLVIGSMARAEMATDMLVFINSEVMPKLLGKEVTS